MANQPPISTIRAGIGCAASVALAATPLGMYVALDGNTIIVRFVAVGVSVLLGIVLGPLIIGWILNVSTIPGDQPNPDVSALTPGADDPIHYIDHDDLLARYCVDSGRHDPHPHFWNADMPYSEMGADGLIHPAVHRLSGATWCRGQR